MSKLDDNRLVKNFAALRASGKRTLCPFVTAGYPDLATTEALLADFEARGVRVCELGIPYSDPVADGPVIQASYTEALAGGVAVRGILEMVRRVRDAGHDKIALITMVSYAIVYRHGVERYLDEAAVAGIDGLIIPDLPLDEAGVLETQAATRGLCNVMLIAPTTPPERRLEIARHSRGFIYYISVAGITGERTALPEATIQAVAQLRTHTDTPVCVGFGISNAETVRTVCAAADGAIVGSAIVHRLEDAAKAGTSREQTIGQIGAFIDELLTPIR